MRYLNLTYEHGNMIYTFVPQFSLDPECGVIPDEPYNLVKYNMETEKEEKPTNADIALIMECDAVINYMNYYREEIISDLEDCHNY